MQTFEKYWQNTICFSYSYLRIFFVGKDSVIVFEKWNKIALQGIKIILKKTNSGIRTNYMWII